MLKTLLASPPVQFVIGRTIGLYMLLVGATTRWRNVNRAGVEQVWAGQRGVIACIWHGRFLLTPSMWAFRPGVQKAWMLISQSREGGIVAHAARTVGSDVVRGSAAKGNKRKGGFEAMREMLRLIETSGCIALTPDGPRGPRMRASLGPIQLAKLSGAPLLPMAWSARWRFVLGSWDKFILPLPFGPGARVWGNLIHVPRDADSAAMEIARLALETELNRISAEADRLAAVNVIEPAAAPVDASAA